MEGELELLREFVIIVIGAAEGHSYGNALGICRNAALDPFLGPGRGMGPGLSLSRRALVIAPSIGSHSWRKFLLDDSCADIQLNLHGRYGVRNKFTGL